MKLNAKALGLSLGVVMAVSMFVVGLIAMSGTWVEGVDTIGQFYLGYDATFVGALIGGVWGFLDGFIGGWLVAWLYNKMA